MMMMLMSRRATTMIKDAANVALPIHPTVFCVRLVS